VSALPRSGRLAAWGTAALTGTVEPARAARVITGEDEPHVITGPGPAWLPLPDDADLARLLSSAAAGASPGLTLVLPVPGDPVGLPGPPEFNAAAVDAGECVLVLPPPGGHPAGLIPEVTEFGSAWEPGALVIWRTFVTGPAPPPPGEHTLAEAERALREAMLVTADDLAMLDVARWRPDAADRISAARSAGVDLNILPPGTPARAARVLATATRVRAIVELAMEDDGAAVTGYEATRRALSTACRHAVVAATNAVTVDRSGGHA
jgi:hypothetical protein